MHKIHYVDLILALLLSTSLHAQRTLSADVEVKSVSGGSVTTTHKQVCCHADGRLVSRFFNPSEYYSIEYPYGEGFIYIPSSNEVYTDRSGEMSSADNLMYIFLSRGTSDMGLAKMGYVLTGSSTDSEGYLKKTFTSRNPSKNKAPIVDVVYKNYLPVYLEHRNAKNKVLGKQYLSKYQPLGKISFPARSTEIIYTSDRDSLVIRTIYSNIKVDAADRLAEFEIPSNAKPISITPGKRK